MSQVAEFLRRIGELGVNLSSQGDKLIVDAPADLLTADLKAELKSRKPEILKFLALANQLRQHQPAIVPLQSQGYLAPIFGVAGHNGDVFCYRELAKCLGPNQPFYGLQPSGYDEGTAPLRNVEELAAYFTNQIKSFRPQGECVIAGYCAGGTVAFELTRQLLAYGHPVRRLILFGAPFCSWYSVWPQFQFTVALIFRRIGFHARRIWNLPPGRWMRYLISLWRVLSSNAQRPPPDPFIVRRAAVEEATMHAVQQYRPKFLTCCVDLILPSISAEHGPGQLLRWRALCQSARIFHGPASCTGDTMLLEDHAAAIARVVADNQ